MGRSVGNSLVIALVVLVGAFVPCPGGVHAQGEVSDAFAMGNSHMSSQEYRLAIHYYTRALELTKPGDRNSRVIRIQRAQAYQRNGELKKAWNDIHQVIRDREADEKLLAAAYHIKGVIQLERAKDRKALSSFNAAIEASPNDNRLLSQSYANRAVAHINLGDPDRAISDLNHAIRLDSRSAFAYAALGLAYLKKDRLDRARRYCIQAMRLDPDPQAKKIAKQVLDELSVLQTGDNRIVVNINDDGQIFVHVRFGPNGAPHRFLLDTGASFTVVSRRLLQEISRETRVERTVSGMVRTADGARHAVTRYRVGEAYLHDMPLGPIEVLVFNDPRKSFHNLLGTNSLSDLEVSIDALGRKAVISRGLGRDHRPF